MLFANPIPEKFALQKAEIDAAIEQAVQEAADQGFHGHTNTPFILSRIKELTQGNSLPANRALIESNVAMAAKVAVELSKLKDSSAENIIPHGQQQHVYSLRESGASNFKPPNIEGTSQEIDAYSVVSKAAVSYSFPVNHDLKWFQARVGFQIKLPKLGLNMF